MQQGGFFMYSIIENGVEVGSVQMEKKGLYCWFYCTCKPQKSGRYHIYLQGAEKVIDLGLCVPEMGNFSIRTSVPVKYIPREPLQFVLSEVLFQNDCILLTAHQPFQQLQWLKTARLVNQSGRLFIRLDAAPDPQDSDQSQGSVHR